MEGTRVILDFPESGRNAGTLGLIRPRSVIAAERLGDVRPALSEAVRAAADGALVVGFVAYEAAPAFDAAHAVRPHQGPAPLLWFAVFDAPAEEPQGTPPEPPQGTPPEPPQGTPPEPPQGTPPRAQPAEAGIVRAAWRPDVDRAAYDDAIRTIRAAIAAGDVYQVNHTLRFHAPCDIDPADFYHALAAPRHGRYHALIETPDWAVISASPELFIDVRDGIVTTRPMKGTARRGRWLDEDRAAAQALARSAKDRAENLMIVDLLRNDLGRIAEFGSVTVDAMFAIETYPTVHQMTSTISARLRDGCTLDDVFAALFPCGSVTGAPKIAAMQQIARLEASPRGPYCGAIGVLRPDGSATFSVAIRTVLVDRRTRSAVYGSGSGITWDSAADAEYAETIAKAALLLEPTPAFSLIETMRMQSGRISRLDLHLERLRSSCEYWGFATTSGSNARRALARLARATPAGDWRVRLVVDPDGSAAVQTTRLDVDRSATPPPVTLARTNVSSADRMLFHKTTARELYDVRRAQCPDAFDVLLHNEHGHITEFTIGNVVCDFAGELCTPPREDGLLAGVFREQLLQEGVIRERHITIADALACERMWLINSVREWVPVQPVATRAAL